MTSEREGEECKQFSGEVPGEFLLVWNMKSKDTKITEPGKQDSSFTC